MHLQPCGGFYEWLLFWICQVRIRSENLNWYQMQILFVAQIIGRSYIDTDPDPAFRFDTDIDTDPDPDFYCNMDPDMSVY